MFDWPANNMTFSGLADVTVVLDPTTAAATAVARMVGSFMIASVRDNE